MTGSDPSNGDKHHNHLSRAYGLDNQKDMDAFYSDWAATYDAEVEDAGYVTPERCAAALKSFAPASGIAILDIGCGTGLSGLALAQAGFTNLTGSEVNPDMLAIAKSRGVYTDTWLADVDAPFPFEVGKYDAITAIGVIGAGAAPLGVLEDALGKLTAGGLCCFSFNDHTLEHPEFEGLIETETQAGRYELLFKEYGPHLPGKNIWSNVYVLKRT